jgi:acetoin:2,6-dichlorophenolindophenol oxidoreductase subunit alpha
MEDLLSEAGVYENPLVPNKKLRQMYKAMVEARILDEHIATLQKGIKARRRLDSTHGEEACRVSTAIELGAGDLISDSQDGLVMELLAGAKADLLLRSLTKRAGGAKNGRSGRAAEVTTGRQMPWVRSAEDRITLAMGAALSFKTLKKTNVVVVYVRADEIAKGAWRKVLEIAGSLELPIIFVILPALPGKAKKARTEGLCAKARSCRVAGIPVDASDAVALYRVMQESLGRTRQDGGPVLIECIPFEAESSGWGERVDPLEQMKAFLLHRKVCTEAWLGRAGDGLRKKMSQAQNGTS